MTQSRTTYQLVTSAILAAVMLLVCSCVKQIEDDSFENGYIAFAVSMNGEQTKAAPMHRLTGEAGVIGYVYDQWPGGEGLKTFAPWEHMDNEIFTFDGYMLTSDGLIRWSQAKDSGMSKLKVFAYAPSDIPVSYIAGDSYCLPSISYTVPSDIEEQKDIVTASAEVSTSFGKNIPLTFDHILTGLKFRAGFECTVKSITISGVVPSGTYTIGEGWSGLGGTQTYTVNLNKSVSAGEMITGEEENTVMFMIPQSFSSTSEASITLTYDENQSITTSLRDIEWERGRMVTYTLHKQETTTSDYIYFDLAAGDIMITGGGNYTGYVFGSDGTSVVTVSGNHAPENNYYVYQTTSGNRIGSAVPPVYPRVMYDENMTWADYITNGGKPFGEAVGNDFVEKVIEAWDNADGNAGAVRRAGRGHTENNIHVSGDIVCNLTIDNIYSRYSPGTSGSRKGNNTSRSTGGIGFVPGGKNSTLTVNIIGDNRLSCIHYQNGTGTRTDNLTNKNRLIFEGTGSLTVADADFYKYGGGYYSNHYNSAIGAADHPATGDDSWGIVINGGVIFAGTTKAENSSAIGGGGNGIGFVTINGGYVTAVATTTGTAIGGGIGYSDAGGEGVVEINGGNVYAYNFANQWNIPSSAIGGAGSSSSTGNLGIVNITDGNVYAQTALGTAIGGGSSKTKRGGGANVTISGGTVIAKSLPVGTTLQAGAGIGGGTGGNESGVNGGTATVTITGNPIIRTGSIGGGKTNNSAGHIGSAVINISGGDIQAQFVMAAGAEQRPSFTMSGGLIRNSDTDDQEFFHVQPNGGAVYLEDGVFTMSGGEIRQCLAGKGGAIYIQGNENTTFSMTGGTITECAAETDGGAVYLEGGNVSISGGVVSHNLANNGNGGGFCIVGGNFSMDDTDTPRDRKVRIFENAAFSQNDIGGSGGGLFVTSSGSDVTVDLTSGSITDNSSDRAGGGISVDMTGHESSSATVTVGKSGGDNLNPSISSNHTIILGGGLYAKGAKANIIINSGRIADNTISGYVSNPDVANEGGMVTLNGGVVTHVTVTYNNNGEYINSTVETAAQKIVTATNSKMVSPEFEILGYKLTGWNTRPDGKGTTYTDGQTMNLSSDLTLYAQWRRN